MTAPQSYILDINVFNQLLDGKLSAATFVGRRLLVTSVQAGELQATCDVQRREDLEAILTEIEPVLLPASSSAFGIEAAGCRPIFRELRISVDGNRSCLPLVDLRTGGIPSTKVEVYKLVDAIAGSGQFSDYFARSRMRVNEDPWPA